MDFPLLALPNLLARKVLFFLLSLMVCGISLLSVANPVLRVRTRQDPSPELIYSTNFSVNNKVYFLFAERKQAASNSVNSANYVVRLSYPRTPATVPAVPPAFIEIRTELVDLNDLDSFVNGIMTALQPIQTQAVATTNGFVSEDAPFGSTSVEADKEAFRKELRRIFQAILVQKLTLLDAPVAGLVRLEKTVDVYKDLSSTQKKKAHDVLNAASGDPKESISYQNGEVLAARLTAPLKAAVDEQKVAVVDKQLTGKAGTFTLDSVQVEVEDGNVLNVKAHGFYKSSDGLVEKFALFENFAPIGISSNQDLNLWHLQKLYVQNRLEADKNNEYILLGRLLQYIPALSAKSSDFSPADGVYTFHANDTRAKRLVYKVATSRILQARIFTDVVGVDQDRPNGLIQLEVNRKFILTNRPLVRGRSLHLFLFKYIDPAIALTKIEEQNKYLYLPKKAMGSDKSVVSTIDLVKYTNFSTGFNLNVASASFPQLKLVFDLDATLRLNRIAIRDSVFSKGTFVTVTQNPYSIGVYGLSLRTTVRPDARYGGSFGIGWVRYSLIAADIDQSPIVNGTGRTFVEKFTYQDVLHYDITLWARIAEHGELFFRPQFTYLRLHSSQNFFQAQLGYQFDVFSNRRTASPVAPLF